MPTHKIWNKNFLLMSLFIGACFFWTSSEYIVWWLFKLSPSFTPRAADLLSEGAGYLFQALGIALFALLLYRYQNKITEHKIFIIIIFSDFLLSLLAFLPASKILIIIFGFNMNLFHGFIAAWYLYRLTAIISQRWIGLVFGTGYAIGTIGSYILSNFLPDLFASPQIFLLFGCFAPVLLYLDRCLPAFQLEEDFKFHSIHDLEISKELTVVPITALVVFLLSFVQNICFSFPTDDVISGAVNPLLVRCFYAAGLVIAGIVVSASRRYGAVCCVCSLIFPFLILAMNKNPMLATTIWIMGYIFFGFLSVYRIVAFADIAVKDYRLLFLSCFGLFIGRLGDCTSVCATVLIGPDISLMVILSALLFIGTIFVFFRFYNATYVTVIPTVLNADNAFDSFLRKYDISQREAEVLKVLITGDSNSEIASKLYISESTVKFHIHNILKKTQCANRSELISLYRNTEVN